MKSLFKIMSILMFSSFFLVSCLESSENDLFACTDGETKFVDCSNDDTKTQLLKCENSSFTKVGECVSKNVQCNSNADCSEGSCVEGVCESEICVCDTSYEPVCGVDGKTYPNLCAAACENVDVLRNGECVVAECTTDEDCLSNFTCEAGICKEGITCNPAMCEMYCEFGFKKDANGCEVCECAENPNPTECQTDQDCSIGQHCQIHDCADEFDCEISGVCVDDMGDECLSDSDCAEGMVCQILNCNDDQGENTNCIGINICVEAVIECGGFAGVECPDGMECIYEDGSSAGVCEKISECNDAMCEMYCEFGFKKGADGCEICECAENPNESECESNDDCPEDQHCEMVDCDTDAVDCIGGNICVDNYPIECRSDADCVEGKVCFFLDYSDVGTCVYETPECRTNLDCEEGFICESNLCVEELICEPVLCDLYCEFGFKEDASGCEICICADDPNECQSDSDCAEDEHCQILNCDDPQGENTNCIGINICVENDPVECRSDYDCEEGLICENAQCVEENPIIDCGGLLGLQCPEGMVCSTQDISPDAMGICVEELQCEPVTCDLYCEFGFIEDVNGCEVCQCAENPLNECSDDLDCAEGEFCELVNCAGVNCEEAYICVENQNLDCRTDDDCMLGEFCIGNVCQY